LSNIIVGTSVIIRDRNQGILLGLRKGGWRPGTWGFPGGKVEWGEYLVDAAIREMKEEIGYQATPSDLQYMTLTEDIGVDYHFITHYFILKKFLPMMFIKNPEPEKCSMWDYFRRDRLPENLFDPVRNLLIRVDCERIWDGAS